MPLTTSRSKSKPRPRSKSKLRPRPNLPSSRRKSAVRAIKSDKGKLTRKDVKTISSKTGLSPSKIIALASKKFPGKKIGRKAVRLSTLKKRRKPTSVPKSRANIRREKPSRNNARRESVRRRKPSSRANTNIRRENARRRPSKPPKRLRRPKKNRSPENKLRKYKK